MIPIVILLLTRMGKRWMDILRRGIKWSFQLFLYWLSWWFGGVGIDETTSQKYSIPQCRIDITDRSSNYIITANLFEPPMNYEFSNGKLDERRYSGCVCPMPFLLLGLLRNSIFLSLIKIEKKKEKNNRPMYTIEICMPAIAIYIMLGDNNRCRIQRDALSDAHFLVRCEMWNMYWDLSSTDVEKSTVPSKTLIFCWSWSFYGPFHRFFS